MTAATAAPVRHRTPRATGAVPLNAARLLRVELRRNAMPWMLPLIAALFWFDSYRPSTGTSPLYGLRTYWNMGQGNDFADQLRLLFAHAFVGAGNGSGSPAQQAVQAALLRGAGIPFAAQPALMADAENFPGAVPGPATGPVYAAAMRLATRPAAARHAWLAAHLAALRAGRLTLQELP